MAQFEPVDRPENDYANQAGGGRGTGIEPSPPMRFQERLSDPYCGLIVRHPRSWGSILWFRDAGGL